MRLLGLEGSIESGRREDKFSGQKRVRTEEDVEKKNARVVRRNGVGGRLGSERSQGGRSWIRLESWPLFKLYNL
jgi:hypothetical protein